MSYEKYFFYAIFRTHDSLAERRIDSLPDHHSENNKCLQIFQTKELHRSSQATLSSEASVDLLLTEPALPVVVLVAVVVVENPHY